MSAEQCQELKESMIQKLGTAHNELFFLLNVINATVPLQLRPNEAPPPLPLGAAGETIKASSLGKAALPPPTLPVLAHDASLSIARKSSAISKASQSLAAASERLKTTAEQSTQDWRGFTQWKRAGWNLQTRGSGPGASLGSAKGLEQCAKELVAVVACEESPAPLRSTVAYLKQDQQVDMVQLKHGKRRMVCRYAPPSSDHTQIYVTPDEGLDLMRQGQVELFEEDLFREVKCSVPSLSRPAFMLMLKLVGHLCAGHERSSAPPTLWLQRRRKIVQRVHIPACRQRRPLGRRPALYRNGERQTQIPCGFLRQAQADSLESVFLPQGAPRSIAERGGGGLRHAHLRAHCIRSVAAAHGHSHATSSAHGRVARPNHTSYAACPGAAKPTNQNTFSPVVGGGSVQRPSPCAPAATAHARQRPLHQPSAGRGSAASSSRRISRDKPSSSRRRSRSSSTGRLVQWLHHQQQQSRTASDLEWSRRLGVWWARPHSFAHLVAAQGSARRASARPESRLVRCSMIRALLMVRTVLVPPTSVSLSWTTTTERGLLWLKMASAMDIQLSVQDDLISALTMFCVSLSTETTTTTTSSSYALFDPPAQVCAYCLTRPSCFH